MMKNKLLYFPKSILDELKQFERDEAKGYKMYDINYDQIRANVHQAYWAEEDEEEGLRVLVVVAVVIKDGVVMVKDEKLECFSRLVYYSDGWRGNKEEALEMAFYHLLVDNIIQPDTRVYQFQGLMYIPEFSNLIVMPWAVRFGDWYGLKVQKLQTGFLIRKIPEMLDVMEPISARVMYELYSTWLTYAGG